MWSRILGLITCLCLMALGTLFISAGHFGGYLTGTLMVLLGLIIFIIILIEVVEQTVNNRTIIAQARKLGAVPYGAIATPEQAKLMKELCAPRTYGMGPKERAIVDPYDPMFHEHDFEVLNTPDPHLIHPDDAKRAARLDIKV